MQDLIVCTMNLTPCAFTKIYTFTKCICLIISESKYKVSVYTGNKSGAGTDANVYITLFGENGDSGEKIIDDNKNNFERGE